MAAATGTWNHAQTGTILSVTPSAPISPEDTVEFVVHYSGGPVVDPSGFGGFYTSPSLLSNLGVAFESVPHSYGRTWFPCLDDFTERSTYEFFIRTAGGKKAWCNGVLLERTPLGGDTLINHWLCAGTMPAYLASVAAANYAVARDTLATILGGQIPVELIANASDTADLRALSPTFPMHSPISRRSSGPIAGRRSVMCSHPLVPWNTAPASTIILEQALPAKL